MLEEVFKRLPKAGLKLSAKKCHFFKNSIKCLGHIVSADGIACDEEKISAVKDWPVPRGVKELQRFLGFTGYYRRFIKDYAFIARPLTSLLKGSNPRKKKLRRSRPEIPWMWGEEQQAAFRKLIGKMTSPPVLGYPNFKKPFQVRVDASKLGLGAVLCQKQESGEYRVIAYGSRTLRPPEENYSTHKLEFLALHWAITKQFHHYLYGAEHFEVTTDHNPLANLHTTARLDAVGHRCMANLGAYNFSVKYKSGVTNVDADALSRKPGSGNRYSGETVRNMLCPSYAVSDCMVIQADSTVAAGCNLPTLSTPIDWKHTQVQDPVLHEVLQMVQSGQPLSRRQCLAMSGDKLKILRDWKRLVIKDSILYRKKKCLDGTERLQLLLPVAMRDTVCRMLHDEMGHLGQDRTIALCADRFYWPRYANDIIKWIGECQHCVCAKSPVASHCAPLESIITKQPLELVTLDYLGLEECKGKVENVLVITDHFTKYAVAVPTRNQTAKTTARAFFDNLVVHYGLPARVHSDQGRNFESRLLKELLLLCGIKKSRTTSYHPQGNGCTERSNRTLISMLRTLESHHKADLKTYIPQLVHAYNCNKHHTTSRSPYELMFGRQPRLAIDALLDMHDPERGSPNYTAYVSDLQKRLQQTYSLVSEAMKKCAAKTKGRYDMKVRGAVPQMGDQVLVKLVGLVGKHELANKWETEPYTVVGIPDENMPVYIVQRSTGKGPRRTLHRNMLLPLALPLMDHGRDATEEVGHRACENRGDRMTAHSGETATSVYSPAGFGMTSNSSDEEWGSSLFATRWPQQKTGSPGIGRSTGSGAGGRLSDDGLEVNVTEGSPQPSDDAVDVQHQKLDPIQSSSSEPSLESHTDTASEEVQALEPSPEQDESPECSSGSIEDLVIDHEELLPSSDNVELPDETETGDEQKNSAPVLPPSRRRRKSPDRFGTTV